MLSPHNQRYFKAGAIYIGVKKNDSVNMTMLLKNTKCNNAVAIHKGVCMFAEMLGIYKPGSVSVTLESVYATNNTLSSISPSAGMFTFHGVNCYINGTKERPSTFRNNFGVVIDGTDANIYLSGDILFADNKGTSGAAIKIIYDSCLHFMRACGRHFRVRGWQDWNENKGKINYKNKWEYQSLILMKCLSLNIHYSTIL